MDKHYVTFFTEFIEDLFLLFGGATWESLRTGGVMFVSVQGVRQPGIVSGMLDRENVASSARKESVSGIPNSTPIEKQRVRIINLLM